MKQPTFHGKVLLPLSVFAEARAGDPLAMERILRYYDGYINKLCTRTLYELDGTPHVRVDEYMKHRLQNKLLRAILKDSLGENAGRRASRPPRPALSYGLFSTHLEVCFSGDWINPIVHPVNRSPEARYGGLFNCLTA